MSFAAAVQLDELAGFSQGLQVPVGKQLEVSSSDSVRFVRIVDYTKNGEEPPRYIKRPKNANSVGVNDLVMIRYGSKTAGKVCRGIAGVIANNMFTLTIHDEQRVCRDYLYFFLDQDVVYRSLNQSQSSSTMPAITFGMVGSLKVPLPPLPTQRKIASILTAYDNLIEINTRRIAILEEMAQAIYQEWFVNFRFPGHEDVKLVDSPLGQIPEGWEAVTLGAIADVNARSIKKGNAPDNINYIDIKSVSTGRIDEICPMPFSESPGRARRIVRHGDVIWSTVRPVRRSYSIILDPLPDTIASTGFAVLSANTVPFSFLYLTTTTDEFATYLVNHATGSAYPAVNGKDFENADMILPPQEIVAQLDEAVGDMLFLAHRLLVKNHNLRITRDLLLPKLISGTLDVEDLDIDVGMTTEAKDEVAA